MPRKTPKAKAVKPKQKAGKGVKEKKEQNKKPHFQAKAKTAGKRKAEEERQEQEEEKKPKAKAEAQSVKQKTESWRKVAQPEPQFLRKKARNKKVRMTVEAREKRSYAKARKFARLLKANQVPDDILQMYTEAAKKSTAPRLFRNETINRLNSQNSKGQYWRFNLGSRAWTRRIQLPCPLGCPALCACGRPFQGCVPVADLRGQRGGYAHRKVEPRKRIGSATNGQAKA